MPASLCLAFSSLVKRYYNKSATKSNRLGSMTRGSNIYLFM
nr:MAG TPA: hypothetical protein [Caudoviricetes sp.]